MGLIGKIKTAIKKLSGKEKRERQITLLKTISLELDKDFVHIGEIAALVKEKAPTMYNDWLDPIYYSPRLAQDLKTLNDEGYLIHQCIKPAYKLTILGRGAVIHG